MGGRIAGQSRWLESEEVSQVKTCSQCGTAKPETEYSKQQTGRDGFRADCKVCDHARTARWHAANPERAKESARRWHLANRERVKEKNRQWRAANHERHVENARRWGRANTERRVLSGAKSRAKKLGIPFALTLADVAVPERCPVLGIKLSRKVGKGHGSDSSPSVDRVIPALGYTPGNVRVISFRANTLKRDGALEELEAVVDYIKANYPKHLL